MPHYPKLVATQRNMQPDGWIGEKFWWRADSRATGELRISGRRLDATPLRARIHPGGPQTPFSGGFWAVRFSSRPRGCWQVTGALPSGERGTDAASLTFVIEVVGLPDESE